MTNKEIAAYFDRLAKIMELHQDNPFKIRTYKNAYLSIRKSPTPLAEMSIENITSIKGIGKNTALKIKEIVDNQRLTALEDFYKKTPKGVIEILEIKGIGPKKVRTIWKDLQVESPVELLYACNENRLTALKGFGKKTQADIIEKIYFSMRNRDLFLYAAVFPEGEILLDFFSQNLPPNRQISFTGPFREKDLLLSKINFITNADFTDFAQAYPKLEATDNTQLNGISKGNIPFSIQFVSSEEYGLALFNSTGSEEFQKLVLSSINGTHQTKNEKAIFAQANLPVIPPELRWNTIIPKQSTIDNLITINDIKGVIHSHSQWSDGHNTIEEMALAAKEKGYEYLVITDHSKSAFYANGLKKERVLAQFKEIEELNKKIAHFYIFKGIESDILFNGNLDYEDSLLDQFDVVIASIHSNLKMDKATATNRLIKAIENPYTHILGHPTGRLLLAREGYPVNFEKVIDACAANQVAIELNANPYRLDLDYQWIEKAINKGVKISINPDAHSTKGIDDIQYGVFAARKGGLTPLDNISSSSLKDFKTFLQSFGINKKPQ